jgi:membrane-associated phospholipid phosphatase
MPLPAPVLPYLGPDGRARPLAVVVHYVIDWLSLIALAIVLLAVNQGVGVTAREYNNETVAGSNGLAYLQQAQAYEYVPDTVSMAVCAVVAIAVPIAVCLLVQPCAKLGDKSWYERSAFLDVHHFVLGLGEAIVCSTLVVELSKKYVGRLRPSAFVRMASPALPQDWNQSWPSGHAATAFCGLGYLALYLSGKLGIFSGAGLRARVPPRGGDQFRGSFPLMLLAVGLPLGAAIFIACSRIVDYAHDFSDINAGAIVGALGAVIGYHLNFTSLADPASALCRPLAEWAKYYPHDDDEQQQGQQQQGQQQQGQQQQGDKTE